MIFYLSILFLGPFWVNYCPVGFVGACGEAYFNSFLFVVVVSSLFQVRLRARDRTT